MPIPRIRPLLGLVAEVKGMAGGIFFMVGHSFVLDDLDLSRAEFFMGAKIQQV